MSAKWGVLHTDTGRISYFNTKEIALSVMCWRWEDQAKLGQPPSDLVLVKWTGERWEEK